MLNKKDAYWLIFCFLTVVGAILSMAFTGHAGP